MFRPIQWGYVRFCVAINHQEGDMGLPLHARNETAVKVVDGSRRLCVKKAKSIASAGKVKRPSVFKTRSKLGTHLSTQCSGDERQSRPCAAR
ncbi:hypothetical protein TNCV_862491 [Trichonephila clavipes]|nr:hypothetical protein TNCV_862491 [Trichonephila clavipes]